MGMSRAQVSYTEAMARNKASGQRYRANDMDLPQRILDPEETVLDVAVGSMQDDTFPLLLVTDRRVILTKNQPWRRWRVLREAPASDVLGAEMQEKLLSGRLRVQVRGAKDVVLRIDSRRRPREVAELLNRLVVEGRAQPR